MPYLEFVYCDKCKKSPLDIDYAATVESYCKDGRRQKDAFINPATVVWDYLMYRCYTCGSLFKYTFRDIERKVREHFSSISEEFRVHFDKLDRVDFQSLERTQYYPGAIDIQRNTRNRIQKTYSKD